MGVLDLSVVAPLLAFPPSCLIGLSEQDVPDPDEHVLGQDWITSGFAVNVVGSRWAEATASRTTAEERT